MNDIRLPRSVAPTVPRRRVQPLARQTGKRVAAVALLCAGLGSGASAAEATAPLSEPQDKINYSVGFEFGHYLAGLKRQGTGVELEAVFRGILDALSGTEPLMNEAAIRKQLDELKAEISGAQDEKGPEPARPAAQARTRGFVDDFAALNAQREGVISLPSGLQYEALRPGTGISPQASDRVAIQYEGSLATGVVFDTTYDDGGPTRLRIDEIAVPGLREALLRMKEGDKWRVVVPPSLGFGRLGNNLLRKRDLIYEVELVSVEKLTQAPVPEIRPATPPSDGDAAAQSGAERRD
jgi:FKBP-type peptidyl-prolyl cis-trans isomerase FklB